MSSDAVDTGDADGGRPIGRWAGRMDVYGDVWMRLLDWGVGRCPFFVEPLLVAGYVVIFHALAGRQRRAVGENLQVLCPEAGWFGQWGRSLRVFWEFGWMVVDGARARSGERHVSWRLDGEEAFREASDGGGAAVLLTAHMGNYDVAGPFFAGRFGRLVHGVRRPERRAELQAYMEAKRGEAEGGGYRVRYNRPDGFLGLELVHALEAGEVVAIQGDRVEAGMGSMEVEWRGRRWPLPSGPLVLAEVASAPVFPVFMIREGWRSYRIVFLPPHRPGAPVTSRTDRLAARRRLTAWWAGTLAGMLERHWFRWLMFEPAFAPAGSAVSGEGAEALPRIEAIRCEGQGTGDRGRGTGDGRQETGDRGQEAGGRGQEAGAGHPPISRTHLGRFLNARGWVVPAGEPHDLPAEDSAQNWMEAAVLTAFTGLLAGAVVWEVLSSTVPLAAAVWLSVPVWFALLHVVPAGCGLVAGWMERVSLAPAGWSIGRLGEELMLWVQTAAALWLLSTPWGWLGVGWLVMAVANGLCFLYWWITRSRD